MRNDEKLTQNIDWPLFICYILLVSMGLSTVYSTAYSAEHPSLFDFSQMYGKQFLWICVSLFLGLLVFLIDSSIYRKFAVPIYLFTLTLLVVVLFMPAINGAHAWLGFGSFGIQPAEFAKIGTALLLSHYISNINIQLQNAKTVLLANLIIVLPMVLIILQPDAGTLLVFTSFLFVLYREGLSYDPILVPIVNLIPGIRFKQTWVGTHFIPILFYVVFLVVVTLLLSGSSFTFESLPGVVIPGIAGILSSLVVAGMLLYFFLSRMASRREKKRAFLVVLIGFTLSALMSMSVNFLFQGLAPHQKVRIELVLGLQESPDGEDYNRNRAMAAVGSGGVFGKGYTKASLASVESNHVPESETDFIFCPFAEEWGFMGSLILIVVYMTMLLRIIVIAERQRSKYYRVYAYAVGMILFYHFAINIGMNIGFAPVIGIPLPFFSYGGSSMMSFSILLFILLKLDSQRRDVLY
ncbi:MAG: rod shape-determining protein RodA [Crocinitomicaceae bacterium]|jgi:rod shape determining protein RodA|nr:rod shape-determining protein RodA [Crocinitomicaceae bacterium]